MDNLSDHHLAQRFLEVVPSVLHSLGGAFRATEETGGPITIAQFRVMTILRRGPCSLSELATLYDVSAPTMSRLISTLVTRGWVQRQTDPQDRRHVILNLTAMGEQVWSLLVTRGIEHLATIVTRLTPEQKQGLDLALEGFADILTTLPETSS